jgi:hypothetical protein
MAAVVDMKITLMMILCGAAVLVSGCAAGITRTGYQLPANQNPKGLQRCPIAIQCDAKYDSNAVEVLGSIDAYDTGFSTDCDEAYVLDIFCREACSVGADLINITEENRPDMWSSCYRAKAEFLRFKDRAKIKGLVSDAKYAPNLIIERSVRSNRRARDVITASVLGGALGGIIVWSATNPHGN